MKRNDREHEQRLKERCKDAHAYDMNDVNFD